MRVFLLFSTVASYRLITKFTSTILRRRYRSKRGYNIVALVISYAHQK